MGLTPSELQMNEEIKEILEYKHIDQTCLIDKMREFMQKLCTVSYNEGYDDAKEMFDK